MRKKSPSSREAITKPTAKRPLQIAKETIRALSSEELTQAVTGVAPRIGCPWNSSQTGQDPDPTG